MERYKVKPDQLVLLILAGNCSLTIESKKTLKYHTFTVVEKEPKFYAVYNKNILIGHLSHMKYIYFPKTTITPSSEQEAFAWLWKHLVQSEWLDKNINIYHHGVCAKCGRKLKTPTSIISGIGPECLKSQL